MGKEIIYDINGDRIEKNTVDELHWYKLCVNCGLLPHEYFDKKRSKCKTCISIKNKQYYQSHKKVYKEKYYPKHYKHVNKARLKDNDDNVADDTCPVVCAML